MKLNSSKLLKLASMGGASLAFAQSVQAATVLSGGESWPGATHNAPLPSDYGSNVAGTPNIALSWGSGPTVNDRWDYYNSRTTADYTPFETWPSDPDANGVFQMNAGLNVAQTILFTPDAGYSVKLQSLDLNDWIQGPNGNPGYNVAWSVTGTVSGTLGSGTFTTVDGTNQTLSLGDLTGAPGEALTLSLTQLDGTSSYLAIDNLAFDQVASTAPAVASFTSDKEYIENPVTLSWSIANPDSGIMVTLDDGTASLNVTSNTNLMTGDGSIEVNPTETTTYTLSLVGGNSQDLTILAGEVLSFSTNSSLALSPGYETTLSWEVRPIGAGIVTVSDGTTTFDVTSDTDPVTGIGSRVFTVPDASTNFVLDVNESGGTSTVRVLREQASSAAFSIDSASISSDGTLTVSWTGALAGSTDWIGLYRVGDIPGGPVSTQWNYLNGTRTPGPGPVDGSMQFSGLGEGDYFVAMLLNDGYEIAQGPVIFSVTPAPVDSEVIRVESIVRAGNNLTITWDSKAGFEYDIYASDTLEGNPRDDWEIVEFGFPTSGDGTTQYTEDLSTLPGGVPMRRFYVIYDFNPNP